MRHFADRSFLGKKSQFNCITGFHLPSSTLSFKLKTALSTDLKVSCFHPNDQNGLTDWQIQKLCLKSILCGIYCIGAHPDGAAVWCRRDQKDYNTMWQGTWCLVSRSIQRATMSWCCGIFEAFNCRKNAKNQEKRLSFRLMQIVLQTSMHSSMMHTARFGGRH